MAKKGNVEYNCFECNFFSRDKSHYTRHLKTIKHNNNVKSNNIYICEKCDFTTLYKHNYDKHINSKKHKQEDNNYKFICGCCKKYKYKQSLLRHEELCVVSKDRNQELETEPEKEEQLEVIVSHLIEQKELVKILCKKLEDQNSKIEELQKLKPVPITNNNTNILLVLNERFSDAISLADFVNNMIIKCDHLLYTAKNGVDKGIVNILMDNLMDLQKCRRPIHTNKDDLFIKGKEKWVKDNDDIEIKKAAKEIQYKQIKNMNLYTQQNPHWKDNEKLQEQYTTIAKHTTSDINGNRIVREIKKKRCELNVIS